ncbi:MAG: FliM/FliN family flagellar motor switch protein, partial [Nitrospiraceae bacterium]
LVNNKLIARGEVVVVNEKYGIRLTDVISTVERVQQLG